MTDSSTLPPRNALHSLTRCVYCGATTNLYTTWLLSTRSMAAVCEDPVACLRRKGQRDR